MNAVLERRMRAIRARALVRRWEYRQRNLARGAWFQVRRFLTFASEVLVVPPDEVEGLLAEGHVPDPAGMEIHPPKILLRISRERARSLKGARPVPVSLGPDFLAADAVVAIGFEEPPKRLTGRRRVR